MKIKNIKLKNKLKLAKAYQEIKTQTLKSETENKKLKTQNPEKQKLKHITKNSKLKTPYKVQIKTGFYNNYIWYTFDLVHCTYNSTH